MIAKEFRWIWLYDTPCDIPYWGYLSILSHWNVYGTDYSYNLYTNTTLDGEYIKSITDLKIPIIIHNIHDYVDELDDELKSVMTGDGVVTTNPLAKISDFYRFNLIYKLGGIYLDMDSIAIKSFNWSDYEVVVGTEHFYDDNNVRRYCPVVGIFGSVPKSNYIKDLLHTKLNNPTVSIMDCGYNIKDNHPEVYYAPEVELIGKGPSVWKFYCKPDEFDYSNCYEFHLYSGYANAYYRFVYDKSFIKHVDTAYTRLIKSIDKSYEY